MPLPEFMTLEDLESIWRAHRVHEKLSLSREGRGFMAGTEITRKDNVLGIEWESGTSERREDGWGGEGRGVGRADEVERAEWSSSFPAPESHYFWCPEGLASLWLPSWGFRFYWERPVWLYLFTYFCFYLVRSLSCFQNHLKINQSRGIFTFHFVRTHHFSVPGECSAHVCGASEEGFLPPPSEFKAESTPKGSHQIELGWATQGAVVILLRQEWIADGILVVFSRAQKLCGSYMSHTPWPQLHILLAHFLSSSCPVFSWFLS